MQLLYMRKMRTKSLHLIVAKLLYLVTRVRFEILLTVNYLTTLVKRFTKGDLEKAFRIIKYLHVL